MDNTEMKKAIHLRMERSISIMNHAIQCADETEHPDWREYYIGLAGACGKDVERYKILLKKYE